MEATSKSIPLNVALNNEERLKVVLFAATVTGGFTVVWFGMMIWLGAWMLAGSAALNGLACVIAVVFARRGQRETANHVWLSGGIGTLALAAILMHPAANMNAMVAIMIANAFLLFHGLDELRVSASYVAGAILVWIATVIIHRMEIVPYEIGYDVATNVVRDFATFSILGSIGVQCGYFCLCRTSP